MKGDFTRLTFDPAQHFSRVLLQQGRVLVDADFNEQSAISAHGLRRLTRDLLGPHAGPADTNGQPGFCVSATVDNNGNATGTVSLNDGHYYVDGLAAENTATFELDTSQYPQLKNAGTFLLYLDVWEEHISWLEDDHLREPALGGPDTTTRAKIAWAISAAQLNADGLAMIKKSPDMWFDNHIRRWPRDPNGNGDLIWPQMQAWTDPSAADTSVPCVADPAGGYRGLENQLYRVEIHADGGPVTFKWSRENGSVAAAWTGVDGTDLLVDGIYDTEHGFTAGQWVELTSRDQQHQGQPGTMVRLVKVDGMRLSVDPATPPSIRPDDSNHPIVRRWDHRDPGKGAASLQDGTIVLKEDTDYSLEAGIHISFPSWAGPGNLQYLTGDYWLIPARPAIGDILWPRVNSKMGRDSYAAREPDGVEHVYAPLAMVQSDVNGKLSLSGKSLQLLINRPVQPMP